MKKIIRLLIVVLGIVLYNDVYASNYELKELIPIDTETTIVTNHFSYQSFYYKTKNKIDNTNSNNYLVFGNIKNISDEDLPISITVALFDKEKKNIGTINYCTATEDNSNTSQILKSKESTPYTIEVTKDYLGKGKKLKDVKYISVLSENINCRNNTGSDEYIGQTIEEIGIGKNNQIGVEVERLIQLLTLCLLLLIALCIYKFLFTSAYQNMDGTDIRQEYAYINKRLKNKREKELRENPPTEPPKKDNKSDKIRKEEAIEASKEHQEKTDLHNMYKK